MKLLKIFLINKTSQNLAFNDSIKGKKCILNFADYNRPGGTYGTDEVEWTQEETLCRDIPGLYEQLLEHQDEYLNGFLYTEFKDRGYDVISCPAPLKGSFDKKAKLVLDAMAEHKVEWPIIGWWGCGVFGRKQIDCINGFKRVLDNGDYGFKGILWPHLKETT